MWIKRLEPYLYGNNYVQISPGMLMGMHNALSTTIGRLGVGYRRPQGSKITTIRSNDDSMTIFSGSDIKTAVLSILTDKSWYQDGSFISQYGFETTTLRPGGKNPPDDLI